MTPKEILIAARAKIEAPERWTQGAYAKTAKRNKARCDSPKAVCWCVIGAIAHVADVTPGSVTDQLSGSLNEAIGLGPNSWELVDWNDAPTRTHAEVLAAFDRAIAAAGDA